MDDRNNTSGMMAAVQLTPLSWMTEKGMVKLRPTRLGLATALLCADNLLSLGYIYPDQLKSALMLAAVFSVKSLWFWIYWHLWKGRNWARLLTVVSSCSVILLRFFPYSRIGAVMQVYMVAETVFCAYLIYWLNTKPVTRFFKAPGNGTSVSPQDS
ncbi:MAG: hypothetical protein V4671_05335 [Armatimonadota bacterium]